MSPRSSFALVRHAFTVDVEDWYHGIPVSAETRASAERRLERGLDLLLEMLAGASVRGTFFVLGPVAREHPAALRRIADAGHEIGCHGWSHDPLYTLTRDVMRDETVRARDAIQEVIGRHVDAYRAAYFSITRASLWALDVLAELGFRYDSSMFPVRNWRYGIADFDPNPQRLQTADRAHLRVADLRAPRARPERPRRPAARTSASIPTRSRARTSSTAERAGHAGRLLPASVGARPRPSRACRSRGGHAPPTTSTSPPTARRLRRLLARFLASRRWRRCSTMSSRERVHRYFERDAARFDAIYEGEKPWTQKLVDGVFRSVVLERFRLIVNLAPVPGRGRVLDVGCGPGPLRGRAGARGAPRKSRRRCRGER